MDTSLSILLFREIMALFLMAAAGFALVKCGILSAKDSRIISLISIYIIVPCTIITSFQIELTESIRDGFLLVLGAAVIAHVVMLLSGSVLKLLKFDPVSRGSVMYSNAGNLVLPLVAAVLGQEQVIYATAFMCIQQVSFWTHCNGMIGGERKPQWKKILTNINVLAVAVGIVLMLLHIRLPSLLRTAMTSFGGILGPMSMLMIGMLLASADLKACFLNPRIWLIALLRLIVMPVIMLLVLKLSGLHTLLPDGKMLLYVTMLAVSAPTATMVTQFAQIHQNRPEYASAINVLSTLLCIATMPLMTELYMLVM